MYYLIQENLFKEEGFEKLISCFKRFDIPYELIKVLPFTDEIEFKTERKDVFIFGSIKLASIIQKYNLYPSAVVNENFNYEVYSQYYKENLLNYDSRIIKFDDNFEWLEKYHFLRPVLDSKVFSGRVFDKEEWEEFKTYLKTLEKSSLTPETLIQVATPKNVTTEVRNWVVNGKVITSSVYRRGFFIHYDSNVDQDAVDFAQEMVNKFRLDDTFVIDVGLTSEGWKIIECGSTSCAGFYNADMQKLVMALEEHYNDKFLKINSFLESFYQN